MKCIFLAICMVFFKTSVMLASDIEISDEKIGSLIWLGLSGKTENDADVRYVKEQLIDQKKISGIILFRHNVESPAQFTRLVSYLKTNAPSLFIAIDQEGGKVQRIRESNGFTDFPSAKTAAQSSIHDAHQVYNQMSQMVKSTGVNCVLGPVVDVDGEPTCSVIGGLERSFGKNPQQVVDYARAFMDEHIQQGILSCLKHFPGHGSACGDTHEGVVDITMTWDKEKELFPYRELLASGAGDMMVMTAHLVHRELDPLYPSTLSKSILTGLLREEIGFSGPIITDDMHMSAILKNYGQEESAILALKAGVTFLLYSNNPLAAKGYDGFEIDYSLPLKIIEMVKRHVAGGDEELAAAVNRAYEISQITRSCLV